MGENNPGIISRIDYVFINEPFFYSILDIKARNITGTHSNGCRMSDHRFLKSWFNIDKTKRGPGSWKLNISYLENERYKIGISNIIQNIDLSLYPITLWETIKQKAKDFSITFAKNEQKSIKQRIKIIEHEMYEMEKGNLNKFDYKRIKTLEAELDEIHDKKTNWGQIRSNSKLRWIEEGEKNSKYFLNLEN